LEGALSERDAQLARTRADIDALRQQSVRLKVPPPVRVRPSDMASPRYSEFPPASPLPALALTPTATADVGPRHVFPDAASSGAYGVSSEDVRQAQAQAAALTSENTQLQQRLADAQEQTERLRGALADMRREYEDDARTLEQLRGQV
jgi:hypothetical protein